MGGTFDPCYILTVNAVSSQMGPSTNKRNATLIQSFMADILSVPAERGIITFIPIPEENLATGGNTILGEMEKAEKQDRGGVKRAIDDVARKSMTSNKKSVPKMEAEVNGNVNGVMLGVPIEKKISNDSSDSSQTERPRTAHGTSAAVNGLRMNPISADELRGTNSSRVPNGRPKSVGAPVRNSVAEQIKQEPIPNVVRQTSQQTTSQMRPQPAIKTKTTPKIRNHTLLAPRPVQVQPNVFTTSSITPFSASTTMTKVSAATQQDKKDKAVYLDMVTALPVKPAPSVSVEELGTARSHSGDSVAAANTAKRRSATMTATMTATRKIPQIPPPPAAPGETRSMNSKLSKRKSFLKVFKRESKVEPWYKQ